MSGAENPLAFPNPMIPEWSEGSSGMSLRDWFAGQALIGLLSRMPADAFASSINSEDWSFEAGDAYRIANAMLVGRAA